MPKLHLDVWPLSYRQHLLDTQERDAAGKERAHWYYGPSTNAFSLWLTGAIEDSDMFYDAELYLDHDDPSVELRFDSATGLMPTVRASLPEWTRPLVGLYTCFHDYVKPLSVEDALAHIDHILVTFFCEA